MDNLLVKRKSDTETVANTVKPLDTLDHEIAMSEKDLISEI